MTNFKTITFSIILLSSLNIFSKKEDTKNQDALYFRHLIMNHFEMICWSEKSMSIDDYDACLKQFDPLIDLKFLQTLLQQSKNEEFVTEAYFVKKCKSLLKGHIDKADLEEYCKALYPFFKRAHKQHVQYKNQFKYHTT